MDEADAKNKRDAKIRAMPPYTNGKGVKKGKNPKAYRPRKRTTGICPQKKKKKKKKGFEKRGGHIASGGCFL